MREILCMNPVHTYSTQHSEHFNQFNVKVRNNLPVKIKIFVPFSFRNWEKSCILPGAPAGQLVWSVRLSFALCVSRSRFYTQSVQCAHWVLAQLVYVLLDGHIQYLRLASVQSETSFHREYVWNILQYKVEMQLCANIKHTRYFQELIPNLSG